MKLNKKVSESLFSVSFSVSLFICIIFVIICLFVALQIKFSLFGNFFSNLLYEIDFLKYSYNLITPHFKKSMYWLFILCYLVKQSYILFFILSFNCIIIYLFEKINKKFKLLIFLLFIVLISIPIYFYNNFVGMLFLRFIYLYIIFILFNYIISKNSIIIKSLILIPILNIFIAPIVAFKYNKSNKFTIYTITSFILLFLNLFSVFCIKKTDYHELLENTFIKFDTYSLEKFDKNKIITILNKGRKQMLTCIDINNLNVIAKKTRANCLIQYIKVNEDRNEMYVYDSLQKKLLVLDVNNFDTKREKILDTDIDGLERIAFDNVSNTICLALDRGTVFIFNMDTLEIIQKISTARDNDGLIFDKDTNSYIFTFWTNVDYFISISLDKNKSVEKHKCLKNQGYVAYSNKNNELYIPFHQQGIIGIFDSKTYKLKYYIKTQYCVKDIYYNEQYNVLFAPSYFTGYMDMFLMDGKATFIGTMFVGFFPREPLYIHKKLLVPSHCGLRIYNLDLDKLIEKHVKK